MQSNKKIVCARWIGRFGNKCHSYLYGKHIEETFGYKFYIPSEWEGSFIFNNPAQVLPNIKNANLIYAAGSEGDKVKFNKNKKRIEEYNQKYNENLKFIDPCLIKNYDLSNVAYTNLVTDAPWFFPKVSLDSIKNYFSFNNELKKTDLYKELSDMRGTYDVAHFRRTDIAKKSYVGGHSMVSKRSYLNAFREFDQDKDKVIWISDEPSFGWKYEKKIPDVMGKHIPWLADFLKLVFARRIFRSNSSFSLFASWISDAEIFAPWLHTYSPGKEINFKFVKGNHPHWMSCQRCSY